MSHTPTSTIELVRMAMYYGLTKETQELLISKLEEEIDASQEHCTKLRQVLEELVKRPVMR